MAKLVNQYNKEIGCKGGCLIGFFHPPEKFANSF